MYVFPQAARSLSLGISPSVNVRYARAIVPAHMMARRELAAARARNRFRRGGGLTGLGIVPAPVFRGRSRPCPQMVEWIPPGCTSRIIVDSNGCALRVPVCPQGPANPPTFQPGTTPAAAGTQYTDANGNIWTYNGTNWTITGNANAGGQLTQPAPVAAASAAPSSAPSTYQPILDWFTQSSLISAVPNWMVALGAGLLLKKMSSNGGKH
jgi:hypothetical protein